MATAESSKATASDGSAFGGHAHRIEPTADGDLSVAFPTEMASRGSARDLKIPLMHGQLQVPALDHEPVDRIGRHGSADFAFELFQRGHGEQCSPAFSDFCSSPPSQKVGPKSKWGYAGVT